MVGCTVSPEFSPEFMGVNAFHPKCQGIGKYSLGQCMERCGAGMVTKEPVLRGPNRALGEKSGMAHSLMVWEM